MNDAVGVEPSIMWRMPSDVELTFSYRNTFNRPHSLTGERELRVARIPIQPWKYHCEYTYKITPDRSWDRGECIIESLNISSLRTFLVAKLVGRRGGETLKA